MSIEVAALIVAAIAATVVITMFFIRIQQRNSEVELAQERARTAAAQQTPASPIIVNVPLSQPAAVAVPEPAPGPKQRPAFVARPTFSNASVEIEITSRLQNDPELGSYAVEVKVTNGIATLSGGVPAEDLKKRAEKLAGAVRGVQSIVNEIAVRP